MDQPKIDGAKVRMDGRDWIVPALSFGQLKRHQERIARISSKPTAGESLGSLEDICVVVHAALSRNYPDTTLEQVEDMVDLANAPTVIAAVMGQSGLVASGEAPAASQ